MVGFSEKLNFCRRCCVGAQVLWLGSERGPFSTVGALVLHLNSKNPKNLSLLV